MWPSRLYLAAESPAVPCRRSSTLHPMPGRHALALPARDGLSQSARPNALGASAGGFAHTPKGCGLDRTRPAGHAGERETVFSVMAVLVQEERLRRYLRLAASALLDRSAAAEQGPPTSGEPGIWAVRHGRGVSCLVVPGMEARLCPSVLVGDRWPSILAPDARALDVDPRLTSMVYV